MKPFSFYFGDIISKCFANTHNPLLPFTKKSRWCTVLLCRICTCFVMLLKGRGVCMCVCILATQRATLAGLFWHSIYRRVIWGLSFSLHPKFLCPCATKISLCVCVNHLSYAHAPLRKGQGCHLIPAALLSYLCVSYSRPLAVSPLGYPSTLFIPIAPTMRT